MKKKKVIVLTTILFFLTAGAFMVKRYVVEDCDSSHKSMLIFWNNTDQKIGMVARPYYDALKRFEVPAGCRVCLPVGFRNEQKVRDALCYIAVMYKGKRYKFNKSECLNALPGACKSLPSVRYMMLSEHWQHDEQWPNIKKRAKEQNIKVDPAYSYLVLTNYGKSDFYWSKNSCLEVAKLTPKKELTF